MKEKIIITLLLLSFFIVGCTNYVKVDENYCSSDSDCACGSHISTGACFYGNKDYVNTLKQCPDFCTGIGGNLEIRCVNNGCASMNTMNEDYCEVDSDCVRQNSCCDCGLGKYVNKRFQVYPKCDGPRCQCVERESVGRCFDNKCTAFDLPVIEPPIEGFCGTSTLGACSTDSDCVVGGCSGQVCQSKNEEQLATTCEFRDCYNADTYGLSCKCGNNKCEWAQTLFVD
jgi:eight-cysteine-cluster-containing protein